MKKFLLFLMIFAGSALAMESGFYQTPILYYDEYGNYYDAYGNPVSLYPNPVELPIQQQEEGPAEKVKSAILAISDSGSAQPDECLKAIGRLTQLLEEVKSPQDRESINRLFQSTGSHLRFEVIQEKVAHDKQVGPKYKKAYGQLLDKLGQSPVKKKKKRSKKELPPLEVLPEQLLIPQIIPAIPVELPPLVEEEIVSVAKEEEIVDDIKNLPPDIQKQLSDLAEQRANENKASTKEESKRSKKKKYKNQKKKIASSQKTAKNQEHALESPGTKSVEIMAELVQDVTEKQEKPLSFQEEFKRAKQLCSRNNLLDIQHGIRELEQIVAHGDTIKIQKQAAKFLAELHDPLLPKNKVKDPSVAADFYRKTRELGDNDNGMACNALFSAIAIGNEEEAQAWIEQLGNDAHQDPLLVWAQGIKSLLVNDQQAAANFFVKCPYKKYIEPEMYDLYFSSIDAWMNQYLEQLYHKNDTNGRDVEDHSILLYSLGRMFIEGSEQWKKQGKKGWVVADQTSQKKIDAVDLIKKASNEGYAPALCYLGTEKLLPHKERMLILKHALDQKNEVFTAEEIGSIRSTLLRMMGEGDILVMALCAYDAHKTGNLGSWLAGNNSKVRKLLDIKQLAKAMPYCSKECFAALSKIAAEQSGIDLFEKVKEELRSFAKELREEGNEELASNLKVANMQVSDTSIDFTIIVDKEGSSFERKIPIDDPKNVKTEPLSYQNEDEDLSKRRSEAMGMFVLAQRAFLTKDYLAAAGLVDQAVKIGFLRHLEASVNKNDRKVFTTTMANLKKQENEKIKQVIADIEKHEEEYRSTLDHQKIKMAKERCREMNGFFQRYVTIKDGIGKNNDTDHDKAYMELVTEMIKKIPALQISLLPDETDSEVTMENRELEDRILDCLHTECLEAQNHLDTLAGLFPNKTGQQFANNEMVQTARATVVIPQIIPNGHISKERIRQMICNDNRLPLLLKSKQETQDKPGDTKIIQAYQVTRNNAAKALQSIDELQESLKNLEV